MEADVHFHNAVPKADCEIGIGPIPGCHLSSARAMETAKEWKMAAMEDGRSDALEL